MSSSATYIVSSRKYRPATFQTVVGQRALTATLKNAITGGKLAQAYLFCGPRGVGKTSCARIFAKTINCLNPTPDGEACGVCESCQAIDRGTSFNLVELDAASNNSVNDIRDITAQVNIPAQNGRYRVFIIDEVHMLSNNAFNAFLKTLEEPPKNVVFILATTERHKVIPTILSRCQVYDFRRITVNDIIDHLEYVAKQEGVNAEREALGVIALNADGAMRDALSIFDQVVASTNGNVTYEGTLSALNVLDQEYYFKLIEIFKKGDVADALLTLKEITDKGFDPQLFVNGLASHIRNLMVSADSRTLGLLETSDEMAQKYLKQATSLPLEWYYMAIKILNDTDFNYKTATNKRLLVELALIRLSRLLSGGIQIPATPSSQQPPFAAPDGNQPQSAPEKPSEATSPKPSPVSGSGSSSSQASNPAGNQSGQSNGNPSSGTPGYVSKQPAEKPPTVASEPASPKSSTGERRYSKEGIRPKSFRLSDVSNIKPTGGGEEKKLNPFTEDEFLSVWNDYAATHPEQRILVSAMRGSTPEKQTDTSYKVRVEHPAQKQAFESSLPELVNYLRSKLNNDLVGITVEIKEIEGQKYQDPKEVLKKVLANNAELAKFLKEVDAELD